MVFLRSPITYVICGISAFVVSSVPIWFVRSTGYYCGLPWWFNDKRICLQCRRHRRLGFSPWVGEIPWRRAWQPTPVFLPGESHGQRILVGYSPWGRKDSNMTEWLHFPKSEAPQSVPTFHLSNFIIFLFDMGTYIKHVLCIRITWDTC